LKAHLNTVGDPASRASFRTALLDYLKPHFAELSPESQTRFEKNPLRILDSKDPKDKELVQKAPSILHHLTPEAKEHFQELCRLLDLIHVPYVIDDKIVRGLDYYNKTVFEFQTEDLGAQNTIGAGGRYDGLIATFDGPDLPGVGFATGLERVLQVMTAQQCPMPKKFRPLIYFIPLGHAARAKCFSLAALCRHNHIPAELELNAKKMQTALQNAAKSEAVYCAIIGDEELQKGIVQLKHMESREQKEVGFDHLLSAFKEIAHA
jgi:histidyl-tRNA synthetase